MRSEDFCDLWCFVNFIYPPQFVFLMLRAHLTSFFLADCFKMTLALSCIYSVGRERAKTRGKKNKFCCPEEKVKVGDHLSNLSHSALSCKKITPRCSEQCHEGLYVLFCAVWAVVSML